MSETKTFQVPSPMPEKLYRLIDGFRLSKALFAACELEVFATALRILTTIGRRYNKGIVLRS